MTNAKVQEGRTQDSQIGEEASLMELREHHQAWKSFAERAVRMIPVLKAQMVAVTQETERATIELLVHLQVLTSSNQSVTSKDRSNSVSNVVTAMQFQDITRQKLEHVGLALDQLKSHLQILLKDPLKEEDMQAIAALEVVEQHYTMEEERRLHRATVNPDYQEPVPIDQSEKRDDSVILF